MRVGIDVGGTFTDFVLLDEISGRTLTHKCLTTPGDPAAAILQGLAALEADHPGTLGSLEEVIHGTTLVINAIIERKGARSTGSGCPAATSSDTRCPGSAPAGTRSTVQMR